MPLLEPYPILLEYLEFEFYLCLYVVLNRIYILSCQNLSPMENCFLIFLRRKYNLRAQDMFAY